MRADMRAWLYVETNRLSTDANYVVVSWLKAKMEPEFVRQAITDWLGCFAEHFEADYVCRAWLEANGEPEVVKEPAIRWLRLYHEKAEAVFVTKFLAKLPGLPIQAVLDILAWCRIHASDSDALWRLTKVARHAMHEETAADFCHTCEKLIEHCTAQQNIDETSADQLGVVVSQLIGVSLRAPAHNDTVDTLFLRWLRHPRSYGERKAIFIGIQRKSYLQRVNLWEADKKAEIRGTIGHLRRVFPDTDIWDLVTY